MNTSDKLPSSVPVPVPVPDLHSPALVRMVLVLAVFAGCCGSLYPDVASLKLPVLHKSLDSMHAEIASRHHGLLYAGASSIDITTEYGRQNRLYLGGFDAGRRNTGVRDPIFAHALYLDDGRTPLVIVSADVIGWIHDDVETMRGLASDRWRHNIIIAAVHDHVGPDTIGFWGKQFAGFLPVCTGRVPDYMELLKHMVARAIDDAVRSARPARIRLASGQVDPSLSLNIHPQIRKQKDDMVRVMAVEDRDGKPIAVLANWGCHAEAMWNDTMLSADWPGVFYRRWEREAGGVPLFLEGAEGGLVTVNPGDAKMALEPEIMEVFLKHMSTDERLALRDRVGNGFADAVLGAYRSAGQPLGPEGVSLAVRHKEFQVKSENWIFDFMGRHGYIQRKTEVRPSANLLWTDVVAARIRAGDRVVADLVTIPGEPAPPLVAEIDASSSAPVRFTLALANDELGYMVRESDWDIKAYEYERTMSLGRETGTVILNVIRDLRAGLQEDRQ